MCRICGPSIMGLMSVDLAIGKDSTKTVIIKNKPMKKYIWAKEGPFHKKGDEIEGGPILNEKERLLAEGWIEEVGQWKPKLGEEYWAIDFDYDDGVSQDRWDDLEADRNRFEAGNYFKTDEDALAAAEKVRALLLSLHE